MTTTTAEIVLADPAPAALALTDAHLAQAADLVLDAVRSENTRRAYRRALLGGRGVPGFLPWLATSGWTMGRAAVQAYRRHLEEAGLAASSVNQALAAVRKLAAEAAEGGLLARDVAQGIATVKGAAVRGVRSGNWLDKAQAQALIHAPDVSTLAGLRDRALLALLIGGGLRREEAARLRLEDVQQRAGRWVIVDLTGKHGRVRSVPISPWTKAAMDAWTEAAGIVSGVILRPVDKGGRVGAGPMTAQAIYNRVARYAERLGLTVAPHDLRRTFAQLARQGGAALEQIQLTLGHASIATTERYLGGRLDLGDAAADRLGLTLG